LRGDLSSQFKGKKLRQGLEKLLLHAWLLSGRLSDGEAFLKKQPSASLEQIDSQQGQYMTQNGQSFVLGVCQNNFVLFFLNFRSFYLKTLLYNYPM
jgi:Na+-transporting NADH:ubiquinone oxidoreductase subunit NqrC